MPHISLRCSLICICIIWVSVCFVNCRRWNGQHVDGPHGLRLRPHGHVRHGHEPRLWWLRRRWAEPHGRRHVWPRLRIQSRLSDLCAKCKRGLDIRSLFNRIVTSPSQRPRSLFNYCFIDVYMFLCIYVPVLIKALMGNNPCLPCININGNYAVNK